jgi:halocyanin-like protein
MALDTKIRRREFLRIAGAGAVTAASASGTAAAGQAVPSDSTQSAPIDYNGFLEDANGWRGPGSTVGELGNKEVHITVGDGEMGLTFDPVAVHVSPGTTIVWEWSGAGAWHNVHAANGAFQSKVQDSGTFEYTVKNSGIIPYWCHPHKSLGEKGAIAVGQVPRKKSTTPTTPASSNSAKQHSSFVANLIREIIQILRHLLQIWN